MQLDIYGQPSSTIIYLAAWICLNAVLTKYLRRTGYTFMNIHWTLNKPTFGFIVHLPSEHFALGGNLLKFFSRYKKVWFSGDWWSDSWSWGVDHLWKRLHVPTVWHWSDDSISLPDRRWWRQSCPVCICWMFCGVLPEQTNNSLGTAFLYHHAHCFASVMLIIENINVWRMCLANIFCGYVAYL